MEITKEALIVGETILVDKINTDRKLLYLGKAGLIHFVSQENNFKNASSANFTIEELQEMFTIEEPQSKVVPLELKVYDFVPVRYRVSETNDWEKGKLVLVNPKHNYPFFVLREDDMIVAYKYCEFI